MAARIERNVAMDFQDSVSLNPTLQSNITIGSGHGRMNLFPGMRFAYKSLRSPVGALTVYSAGFRSWAFVASQDTYCSRQIYRNVKPFGAGLA